MIRHTVAILLLMTGAAFAQDVGPQTKSRPAECAGGNAVQKWLTVVEPNGRAVRVPMNNCDRNGNPTVSKTYKLTDAAPKSDRGPCIRYADAETAIWIKDVGATDWRKEMKRTCLEHAK